MKSHYAAYLRSKKTFKLFGALEHRNQNRGSWCLGHQ